MLARHARAWSGTVYRAVPLAYSNPKAAFSGEGARQGGGRWNSPGRVAIYASLVPEHAFAERLAIARRRGAPDREVLSTTILSAEVEVESLVSSSDLSVDERERIDPNGVLTTFDWVSANDRRECAPSQLFGEVASRSGTEALLVPSSAVSGALVVVLFPDRFQVPGRLRVQGAT